MSGNKSFSEKMSDLLRHILSCCDKDEEEDERPALQISGPTNFRREDISIPGLDPVQQRFIREKAISDAGRMYDHLQPLRSSPSGHFASPNNTTTAMLPSREQFVVPRSADSPLDRIMAHSRKISNSLTMKPAGYQTVSGGREMGSPYEMRALMEPSRMQAIGGGQGKLSGESFSVAESEEDGHSGTGMVRL